MAITRNVGRTAATKEARLMVKDRLCLDDMDSNIPVPVRVLGMILFLQGSWLFPLLVGMNQQ